METGLSFPHLMCVYSVQDVTFRESTGGATPIPEAAEQRWSAGTGAGDGDGGTSVVASSAADLRLAILIEHKLLLVVNGCVEKLN